MNQKIKPLVLTATFFFCQSLHAGVCSSIDLRNETLGQARHQGVIGWCFAHAAADLITYKIGKRVSVTELGTTYFKYHRSSKVDRWEDEGFKEGGWVKSALKTAINNDVCLEEDMPSENFQAFYKSGNKNWSVNTIPAAIDWIASLKTNPDQPYYVSFPRLPHADIISIIKENPLKDAWEEVVDRSCEGRKIELTDLSVKSPLLTRISSKKSFNVIDRELENQNILGLSYYAGFLKDVKAKKTGSHASVIVGRRWNSKNSSCEYLIRNSWGTGCSSYDPSLKCEEGHVWVPKTLLKKHIQYVDYLKD